MIENIDDVFAYMEFMEETTFDARHFSRIDPSDPLYDHVYTLSYHSLHRSHTRDCDNVFLDEPANTFPEEVERVVKWSVRSLDDSHRAKCNHEDDRHFDPVYMYEYTLQLHQLYMQASWFYEHLVEIGHTTNTDELHAFMTCVTIGPLA